jgi:hypothetical protein
MNDYVDDPLRIETSTKMIFALHHHASCSVGELRVRDLCDRSHIHGRQAMYMVGIDALYSIHYIGTML